MKKSHILVLSLAAFVTLSACERRVRPPKPEAQVADDTTTTTTPTTPTTEPGMKPTQTDPATTDPTPADLAKRYQALEKELLETNASAMAALELGFKIELKTKSAEGATAHEVSFQGPESREALDLKIKEILAKPGQTLNESAIAQSLHLTLTQLHTTTQGLQAYKSESGVVAVKGVEPARIEAVVKGAQAIIAKIKKIDAYLHDSKLVSATDACSVKSSQ